MKQIFTLLTISVLLTGSTVFSSIDEVIAAMKTGNAAEVSRFFDNTVKINMIDKSKCYSKINGVKSFTVIHKGENSGSQFCIGTLVTKTASYRTTIFMKQKGDKQVLQGITFE